MADAEQIFHGARKQIVFLSAQQAEAYGGYARAGLVFGALVIPPAMIEDYWQDLAHLPPFIECGHA